MNGCGSKKWLLIVGALAVVVALASVACGSTSDERASVDQGPVQGVGPQASPGGPQAGAGAFQNPADQRRDNLKERREAIAARQEALVDNVREDMSAEDQALYDELKASVEAQRDQLQQARQKLADTLKELRALVDKYLELEDAATD